MSIPAVLAFMQHHLIPVFGTNPYDKHLLLNLYQDAIINGNSCFWIPPFLCDILRLQAPQHGQLVDLTMMRPGHYYFLECLSHYASILYLDSNIIYYVDYYVETGRASPFRIEQISIAQLYQLITSASTFDVEGYVNFHGGNADHLAMVHLDIQYNRPKLGGPSLIEAIYEQPLQDGINLHDLLRVIDRSHPSFPMSDIDANDYTEEDFEGLSETALPLAIQHYEMYLQQVHTLLT